MSPAWSPDTVGLPVPCRLCQTSAETRNFIDLRPWPACTAHFAQVVMQEFISNFIVISLALRTSHISFHCGLRLGKARRLACGKHRRITYQKERYRPKGSRCLH